MMKDLMHNLYRVVNEKTHRDSLITFVMCVLLFMGLIFSASGSMNTATTRKTTLISFAKQIGFTTIGFIAYHSLSILFDADKMKEKIDNYIVLIIVMSRAVGGVNNSYSWIPLPFGMSIQPSEFAKIIVVLMFASYFGDRKFKSATKLIHCIKFPGFFFLTIVGIIIILQKDTGSGFICFLLGCLIFLIPENVVDQFCFFRSWSSIVLYVD